MNTDEINRGLEGFEMNENLYKTRVDTKTSSLLMMGKNAMSPGSTTAPSDLNRPKI